MIIEAALEEIGESFGSFRLPDPRSNEAMAGSIRKYGQTSPVVVGPKENGVYELVDGFKRLYACRKLGRPTLTARVLPAGRRALKAAVIQLNWAQRSIGDLDEALVLRSLYREDGLTQPEIGALLGRHKSWVCRRISLIERLCDEVVEQIRLGLCQASVGRELARLPRGNQESALQTILKYRFNYRETALLVDLLLKSPRWDQEALLGFPAQILEDRRPPRPPMKAFSRIMAGLTAMNKQGGLILKDLCPQVVKKMIPSQRTAVCGAVEAVEGVLGELKKSVGGKADDADLL